MAEVGLAASIVAVIQITTKVASLSYVYVSGVKRAPDDVRKLVNELKSLTTVLTTLQICAQDHGLALRQLEDPLRKCISEMFMLQAKLEPRTKPSVGWWGVTLSRLHWPFGERETLDCVSQIERFKSLFTLAMSADQLTRAKAIEASVKEINERRLKGDILQIDKRRTEVLNWLYPDAFEKRHIEISGRRQKNTGQWILKTPEIQDWAKENPKHRLLWGYGIPGAGKTFLSSLLIDNLRDRAIKRRYGVAYIYFNYIEQDQQKPGHFLASMVKQLACQIQHLPKEIEDLYKRLEMRQESPTLDDLYTILLVVTKSFAQTFVVCDALDECNQETQRKELLPLFHRMGRDEISLFITSREYPEDIQHSFRSSTCAKIRLCAKDEDITFYIEQTIAENPRAKRLVDQGNCKDRIISELNKCANGTFLLVHFHIKFLCQQATFKQILVELDRLKSSSTEDHPMDPTYNKALEALRAQPKACVELALKILSWLVKARRVLTVRELQLAVSVGQGCTTFDESDLPDRNTLLDVCASLVMIDEKEDTIRLVHYTVQEYLFRKSIVPNDIDSNFALTMACTKFLSFDIFAQGACTSDSSLQYRWRLYPFLDYAAKQLSFHLGGCDEALSTELVLRFVKSPGSISSYIQALHVQKWSRKEGGYNLYPKKQTPLHVAASLGHKSVVRLLLEDGADISAADKIGRTSLYWAAFRGHESVAQLLLEKGADVLAADNAGVTAKRRAVWAGHGSMAQLLKKAEKLARTTLHEAADEGSLSLVRLLLEKGANSSAVDDDGRTPLHNAASKGHVAVAQLLLEAGADISAADSDGRTALHHAAAKGHPRVQVVKKGAGNSAADLDKWVPNSWRCRPKSVFQTAKKDANISAIYDDRRTTARYGSMVQLLLEKGADISATDKDGRTALHIAAFWGHRPMARLLFERGASTLAADKNGRTALYIAESQGHESMVRLMLWRCAGTPATHNNKTPALHMAVSGGSVSRVQLLLEEGADVSATDWDGQTALHIAALVGDKAVAKLLLEEGADISATDKDGLTALHVAASQGNRFMARVLVKRGADVLAIIRDGKTALHIAAFVGDRAVVKLLLEEGAGISASDKDGMTALHVAASQGDMFMTQMLVERGADASTIPYAVT